MAQDTVPPSPQPKKTHSNFLTRLMGTPLFWVVLAVAGFIFPVAKSLLSPPVKALPSLGQIKDFELLDQDGKKVIYSKELRGQVLVVNFVFTRCPDVCPLLTKQMAKLQKRFDVSGPFVRLVSISVDPEFDKPEVLKAYAERFGVKKYKWLFLTGDLTQIQDLVVNSFKVAMDIKDNDTNMMDVTHAEHFVVIDPAGHIRSYRRAHNESDLNYIVRDVGLIINSKPLAAHTKPEMISLGNVGG